LAVFVHRQHDDARAGQRDVNLPGGINAVQFRHGDIHQNQVGFKLLDHFDGIAAVGGFAYHIQIGGGLQQRTDSGSHQGMVFNDKHIQGHTFSLRFS
jgi:hypothetical protein